jgi:ATP-binding cassette subfamily B protein RaxB
MRVVLQAENAECGLACIAMLCSHHGRSESLSELRRRFPVSLTGASLKRLITVSGALGFSSRAVKCDIDELPRLDVPCLLHWNMDHYVVLQKASRKTFTVLDPARGLRKLSTGEISRHFTGVALELTPAPHFEKRKARERVELRDLWSRSSGLFRVLMQLFLLTLLLQAFGLIMPIANQLVIDDAIGRGDRDLLLSVIVGFGLFALMQSAIELLRGYIQLYAGQRLSLQLTGNLIRHMLRLPIEFFERRHVGDILSRYGSLTPVQDFLTSGITGVLLDAIMVVPAGIIMFMYAPLLSAVVIAGVLLVLIVEVATFGRSRRYMDDFLSLSAKTQSLFLETIRAVRAIKLAGRESERHVTWQNALTDQQNLSFRQSAFNLWGGTGFGFTMSLQGLLLLYLGAIEVIGGHLSLGMLIAFQSYAGQFATRTRSLLSQFFAFRMLGLHLERLSDIVHAAPENGVADVPLLVRPLKGEIEIRKLDFRYSPQDPWILRNVNLHVAAGERVVFVGPSGGGKSTLLKVLTALYSPVEGDLLVDGVPLAAYGVRVFRDQIGVVMQDDQLLSGTIADNVAFSDSQINMERVEEVCRRAHIHDEIIRLPMGYYSLIGDMGSTLSGGQKQRVLLARALYRQPRILFMDEGTANLDVGLEDRILADLGASGITQIMVAHRQAVVEFADKAYLVSGGSLVELKSATLAL